MIQFAMAHPFYTILIVSMAVYGWVEIFKEITIWVKGYPSPDLVREEKRDPFWDHDDAPTDKRGL